MEPVNIDWRRTITESGEQWVRGIETFLESGRPKPIHFVGIGNPIRKDDAVGLYIVSALKKKFGTKPDKNIRIHSSTLNPEILLSKISAEEHTLIVFDAVEHNSEPGSVIFVSLLDTKVGFFATHNLPLKLIPGISKSTDSSFILGIQPGNVDIGEGLTEIVADSANRVIDVLGGFIEAAKLNGRS